MTLRYGAMPEEWAHLDLVLGMAADLLPVVSNPQAIISPRSDMRSLGKTPSLYNRQRQVAGIKDWTNYQATPQDITKWEKEPDYGVCIQTRDVRALDIDVSEPVLAEHITTAISEFLEGLGLPKRYRVNSGKCLLAFRVAGALPKRRLVVEGGIIEFLANGQQFVAYGTHPSGVRYEWEWNGHIDFPLLTLEQANALWVMLEKKVGTQDATSSTGVLRNPLGGAAQKDDTMDALAAKNLVLNYGQEGQAYIECPWKHEHTTESGITETAYFPKGTRGYDQGHFKCLHAHCEGRKDEEFLDAFGLRVAEFEVLPDEEESPVFNIRLKGGNLPQEIDLAQEAILAAKLPYYQRGPALVRPVEDMMTSSKGRKTSVTQLFDIDAAYLNHDLCRVANWLKLDGRTKKWMKVNTPPEISATLLSQYGNWRFPKIMGVISTPTLRADGSLLCKEGFDEETGLLLVKPPAMPEIPDSPSRDDALKSLRLLKDLLSEFPFISNAAYSVALSSLITPVVRGAFPTAPMHIIRAPAPGSGKSFLLDIASAIAIGQPCPVIAAGRNEEETEKRLGAVLISGQPIINIDNMNGALGGDFLCQLIERPIVGVRVLGRSQVIKVESRSTLFATGNNIKVLGDMSRRVVMCTMDSKEERPELRQFRSNPVETVLNNRGEYIAATLTIARAYIIAGLPGKASRLASFGEWSDIVRSALMWLGEADPVETMELAREEDPMLQGMAMVFTSMHECIGQNIPKTAVDILKIAMRGDGESLDDDDTDKYGVFYNSLLSAAGGVNGRVTARDIGRWLSKNKGRIVAGLRLENRADTAGHPSTWWVSVEDNGSDLV